MNYNFEKIIFLSTVAPLFLLAADSWWQLRRWSHVWPAMAPQGIMQSGSLAPRSQELTRWQSIGKSGEIYREGGGTTHKGRFTKVVRTLSWVNKNDHGQYTLSVGLGKPHNGLNWISETRVCQCIRCIKAVCKLRPQHSGGRCRAFYKSAPPSLALHPIPKIYIT